MNYIQGIDRNQLALLPAAIDDFVEENNPVRVIDAYVNSLDLTVMGFVHTELSQTGRPPFDPRDLLKLYTYGYLNKTRSSRTLHRATKINLEVIWLMKTLTPCFKAIADFRKTNIKGIKRVCREFTLFCKAADLFGGEFIAIDGSKFSAVNHSSRHHTKEKVKKDLVEIDRQVDEYLQELDQQDEMEREEAEHEEVRESKTSDEKASELQEKIALLQAHKQKLKGLEKQIEENGQTQTALTDPDSRMMRASTGMKDMSYNIQIVTDAKHKLIVTHEVTNAMNDRNELSALALVAKEILGSEELDAVADAGYYNVEEIKRCEERDIRCYIPTPAQPNGEQFSIREFRYDATSDCYICPQGEKLHFRRWVNHEKKRKRIYEGTVCGLCNIRSKCTRRKEKNRTIYRWEQEAVIETMRARCLEKPEKIDLRKGLVEHPFGTIKQWMDQRYFLMRGKENVSGEFALTVLAYNLKRVLNILGVTKMLEMIASVAKDASLLGQPVFAYFSLFPSCKSLIKVIGPSQRMGIRFMDKYLGIPSWSLRGSYT
jgi:transposase